MVIGHLNRKPHWLYALGGGRDLTLCSPACCCLPQVPGGQVDFAGWGCPQGAWPKAKCTCPHFQCWPIKGTAGRETKASLGGGLGSPSFHL